MNQQNQSKIALPSAATNPKDNNSETNYFAVLRGGQGKNKFQLLTPYLTDKNIVQDYLTQLKTNYPDSYIGHWTMKV